MKKIKWNLIAIIFLTTFIAGCNEQRTGIVDVKFSTEQTKIDLDKIQEDLKSQNIDLTYNIIEFNEQGYLKKISASINYNDGQKGSFESRELQSTDGPGFYRDFSEN
jgi:hypothetical protein